MNISAVSSVDFVGNNYKNNVQSNKDSVTISKNDYNKLRQLASKGVTAMAISAALMGGSQAMTSCTDDYDLNVKEISQEPTNISDSTQNKLFEIMSTLGVYPVTRSNTPKFVEKLSYDVTLKDGTTEKRELTYDSKHSDKSKSAYVLRQSDGNSEEMKDIGIYILKNKDDKLVVTKAEVDENFADQESGTAYSVNSDGTVSIHTIGAFDEGSPFLKREANGDIKKYRTYLNWNGEDDCPVRERLACSTIKNVTCIAE